ncbi:unnamed protein product [Albugo candida]|uniref:Uncharacterized protein n=1 Tax=Albugo candida TaxID=65357 RepID=A0A024GFH3_9STRA|nr:unnamed protein product [Albugo candida]|eukprot:CCI45092.1 unnamed protein product [Albugo candida]
MEQTRRMKNEKDGNRDATNPFSTFHSLYRSTSSLTSSLGLSTSCKKRLHFWLMNQVVETRSTRTVSNNCNGYLVSQDGRNERKFHASSIVKSLMDYYHVAHSSACAYDN